MADGHTAPGVSRSREGRVMARRTDRAAIAFYVPRAVGDWLARLARDAGDADADAAARGLIERIAAEDMAAEGASPAGGAAPAAGGDGS